MRQNLISIDLFPANVTTPTAAYVRCRLVVLEGRAYLWQEKDGQVPLVEQAPVAEFYRDRSSKAPYVVVTSEGETWTAGKFGGCGCGSPLKQLDWRTQIRELQKVDA